MRVVTFLTDYGLADPFVGLCHAVLQQAAPGVRVVDLSHAVARQDVRQAALLLADCLPWLPHDAVHLAVVDPGVGTGRRPLALSAGNALLVGPDNGLLWPAAQSLGGIAVAVELPVGDELPATFHGRDVFAPAAGSLAAGARPADLGTVIDAAGVIRLALPLAAVTHGIVEAEVVAVDGFGNLQLSARPGDLRDAGVDEPEIAVRIGEGTHLVPRRRTFADVGPGVLVLVTDSVGRLALAVNRGDAAARLGAAVGTAVRLLSR